MRRLFEKEFWNTPIIQMSSRDRILALLLFIGLFLLCMAVAGVAAWEIINGQ